MKWIRLTPEGVSSKQLWPVLLLSVCESYSGSSVVTYAGFMVVDLIPGLDSKKAGYFSGLLMSAFFLCQFISSPVVGRLSGTVGRKKLLVFGTFGNILLYST